MQQRRTGQQIQSLLEEYRSSGLSRREFAQQQNVSVKTLDNWRRKYAAPKLVEVTLEPAQASAGFAVLLKNGRRIEIGGRFTDAELARLIRIAESA